MENLQQEIEIARRKLNESLKDGYDADKCYELSVKLDRLIEEYVQLDGKSCMLKPEVRAVEKPETAEEKSEITAVD